MLSDFYAGFFKRYQSAYLNEIGENKNSTEPWITESKHTNRQIDIPATFIQ